MSAVVLKPCCICGQAATKKLARGKSNCKDICGGAVTHRECLDKYCVLCGRYASEGPHNCCLSCGAKIHTHCMQRESRRPENLRLGHRWTVNVTSKPRSDPVDVDVVEDICSSFDSWMDEREITKRAPIGAFERRK